MAESLQQFTEGLTNRIDSFETQFQVRNVGTVFEAGDGIAQASGLTDVRSQELVKFENGLMGIAFNLEKERVGIIVLGDYSSVYEGMKVETTGRIASVPVGETLIGRVVNALGEPIDGKGEIKASRYQPLERIAPGVIERKDVDSPVQTGIKSIDAMIPVGRGQRELIIGDRQTGKTAIAIDTIINQKGKDLICIYVAIGQKKAAIARTVALLEEYGAMDHTIIVSATADESAAMLYIAPYAGCAIGEDFMQRGFDALVIYDDLSKHAWAYRAISLLLRRPPGREAYPGDVFYLHSRLLERAAAMANEFAIVDGGFEKEMVDPDTLKPEEIFRGPMSMHDAQEKLKNLPDKEKKKIVKVKGSGGSLTALPIIETLLGDVSAYIPTNVISITDGQIFLQSNLFYSGIRPAINAGLSVSRVGGAAQYSAIKKISGTLRLDLASYRELEAFTQFGSDLDDATKAKLERGQRTVEIMKQELHKTLPFELQAISIFALTKGHLDSIKLEDIKRFETELHRFFLNDAEAKVILDEIRGTKALPDFSRIKAAIDRYKGDFI